MKKYIFILLTTLIPFTSAFADNSKNITRSSKFAMKKILVPLTVLTIASDAEEKCKEIGCDKEMTTSKGVEIAAYVLDKQWTEVKEASSSIYELGEALIDEYL